MAAMMFLAAVAALRHPGGRAQVADEASGESESPPSTGQTVKRLVIFVLIFAGIFAAVYAFV